MTIKEKTESLQGQDHYLLYAGKNFVCDTKAMTSLELIMIKCCSSLDAQTDQLIQLHACKDSLHHQEA